MSGGRDLFSILNKNPTNSIWKLPEGKAKVNRYRIGKKPKLAGDSDGSSSSSAMFSDDDEKKSKKSKITHFSLKSTMTTSSGVVTNNNKIDNKYQSQIISKSTQNVMNNFK